ncbi:MAG: metal-sensing transcriptional repressor [Treponema sp.]|jgi:DNA-binding FrmR family transcriptional regulator|nr:metal-sensing transcriptional repressor [Treponema sp.]
MKQPEVIKKEAGDMEAGGDGPRMHCCCGTSGKKKVRTSEEKKALITRLNRIEGQIRGIRTMIEDDVYCVDVLTQVSAAQSALSGFSRVMLDRHIRTCVADGVKNGDDAVLDELLDTIRRFMK